MAVYVDLDNVLVDLDAGFEWIAKYPLSQELEDKMGKEEYWSPIEAARPGFWAGLPKRAGADRLLAKLTEEFGLENVFILSGKFRSHEECEAEKREWVAEWTDIPAENVIICYRSEKKEYATSGGVPNLLVDDSAKTCGQFREAGGKAILHTETTETLKHLEGV